MVDFSSRFAVAITADDQTAPGAKSAERTVSSTLGKSTTAAKLSSSETAKALEKGLSRPMDAAKRKTAETDKAILSLRDRVTKGWHTGGFGKAFEGLGQSRRLFGEAADKFGSSFTPAEGLTSLLSGGGLVALMAQFGSGANALANTSTMYEANTDALQRWSGAARLAGVDASAAVASIQSLTDVMYVAANGRPEGAKALSAAQGIELRTGVKLNFNADQDAFLKQLNQAYQKLSVHQQRIANEAFGTKAFEIELQKPPTELAQDLANVDRHRHLTKEQIDDAKKMHDAFVGAEDATKGFAEAVESKLAPQLTSILTDYTSLTDKLKETPGALDLVKSAAVGLAGVAGIGAITLAIGAAEKAFRTLSATMLASPIGRFLILLWGVDKVVTSMDKGIDRRIDDSLPGMSDADKKKLKGQGFFSTEGLRLWFHQLGGDAPPKPPLGANDLSSPATVPAPSAGEAPKEPHRGANDLSSPGLAPKAPEKNWFDRQWDWMNGAPKPRSEIATPPGSALAAARGPALTQSAGAQNLASPMSESDMVKFFETQGWAAPQARGIVAGAYAESKLDPTAVNPKSGAYGIGQWLGPRKEELMHQYGPQPTLPQQLAFLDWELKGGDRGGRAVQRADTDTAALDAYIRRFERPAPGAETSRDLRDGNEMLLELRHASTPDFARGVASPSPAVAPDDTDRPVAPPDLAAYQPTGGDSSHEVMVRFVDAPRGMRADLSRARGAAKLGVRIEHSMPA